MQGSLSLREHQQHPQHQVKHEHPDGVVGLVLHRSCFEGWQEVAQSESLPATLPKESLGRYEDFWILGGDLQKHGRGTATEL